MREPALLLARRMLIHHEGFSAFPYNCPSGKITIGYGRNLEDRGISKAEALKMLEDDIMHFHNKLENNFDFYFLLSENRKSVLINMCFNLGWKGFNQFKRMLAALENEDYLSAADEMLDSLWASQVKDRAEELAEMMRSNKAK